MEEVGGDARFEDAQKEKSGDDGGEPNIDDEDQE